ncbi:hypothetical protein KIL84_001087 [Mauremys mutica]|uniref:Uncharacterized protein n=1 Tax=Mauremys mutica TaxID=74926 RepID=A0A9D3WZS4_9SAUR|nr:hypothetical protein KIL84_001087 [Mauremys mutica]
MPALNNDVLHSTLLSDHFIGDSDPCVEMLPKLYLDIHNYCVLAKLRNFVAYPACQRVPQVSALKEKIRSLYTIMISFCRRLRRFLRIGWRGGMEKFHFKPLRQRCAKRQQILLSDINIDPG